MTDMIFFLDDCVLSFACVIELTELACMAHELYVCLDKIVACTLSMS